VGQRHALPSRTATGRKRKGCGAHRKTDQELARAALRFARSSLEALPRTHNEAALVVSPPLGRDSATVLKSGKYARIAKLCVVQ